MKILPMSDIQLTEALLARFWAKVLFRGMNRCWIWTGTRNPESYGQFSIGTKFNKRVYLAHRLAWLIHNGDPGQELVLHECDNPPCINPAHLFLGTMSDNQLDSVSKGRASLLKYSEEIIQAVRQSRKEGYSYVQLAKMHGMSSQHAWQIVNRLNRNVEVKSNVRTSNENSGNQKVP